MSTDSHPAEPQPWMTKALCYAAILVGILLKLVLLSTSQSLPDGDEAVEGLMALDINTTGVHPVYPYGVNYGAGAGWEAHLAAVLFLIAGPTSTALKSAGLLHWLCTLGLAAALAEGWRGRSAALLTAALFALAPQSAQWGLKTGGGHQVAVLLALLGWLCLQRNRPWLAVVLMPLAALAHPTVLPFAAAVSLSLMWTADGWPSRLRRFLGLISAASLEFAALFPPAKTVWSPSAESFQLWERLQAMPRMAVGLFAPNLNSELYPSGMYAVVAIMWLLAVIVAAFHWRQASARWIGLLAPWGIVALVASDELAPRHILILSPICIILLGCELSARSRIQRWCWLTLLGLSGCAVQLAEVSDPCIYGPGTQAAGVNRENFSQLMQDLEVNGIRHVYCTDPMLQWNIAFASREQILARWLAAEDRIPRYIEAVDRARMAGEQVALVLPDDETLPPKYGALLDPPAALIDSHFAPSPLVLERLPATR